MAPSLTPIAFQGPSFISPCLLLSFPKSQWCLFRTGATGGGSNCAEKLVGDQPSSLAIAHFFDVNDHGDGRQEAKDVSLFDAAHGSWNPHLSLHPSLFPFSFRQSVRGKVISSQKVGRQKGCIGPFSRLLNTPVPFSFCTKTKW